MEKRLTLLKLIILLLILAGGLIKPTAGQEPLPPTPTPSTVYLPLLQTAPDECQAPTIPPPVLLYPIEDQVVTEGEPLTFTWQPLSDPADCFIGGFHYTLQIALDRQFTSQSIVRHIGYQAGDELTNIYQATRYRLEATNRGRYYWRVVAFNGRLQGAWSDPRRITVTARPTDQLLANPSFEDDSQEITPWQWLGANIDYRLEVDATVAHEGRQYLTVNRTDNARGNKSFYQEIDQPAANQTYRFAIWVRASDDALNANRPRIGRLSLWAHGSETSREHGTTNFQINRRGWHCVETSLTVRQDGHAWLRAEIYLTALDDLDYYFDKASLRHASSKICPPPVDEANDRVVINRGAGFDACAVPTPAQLAVWKTASPYDYVGIYLGGVNHYQSCREYNQQHLNSAWLAEVSRQGWQFIPIWVGPQAPCTTYRHRLNNDPAIAWQEGQVEARTALEAAYFLGLTNLTAGTIIYYDLEAYPRTAECDEAVQTFLAGWVNGLQTYNQKAGIYSHASLVNTWYTLDQMPDSVWAAWHISPDYDPAITVQTVNQRWVNESYWENERLFQYTGGHDERWGGVSLNVDSNVANGLVARQRTARNGAIGWRDMQLLTPQIGWLWRQAGLFWTTDGGQQWAKITPATMETIQAVYFVDQHRGWLFGRDATGRPVVAQTVDSGRRWQTQPFTAWEKGMAYSAAYLDFVDEQTGWLVIKLSSSLNVSRGLLFQTTDGGDSWQPLTIPLGEPVQFIDHQIGWTAGGPLNNELYITRNGGRTWQAQPIGSFDNEGLYRFHRLGKGFLSVTPNGSVKPPSKFYRLTKDGEMAFATRPVVTLPADTMALEMVNSSVGWAYSRNGDCRSRCHLEEAVWRTTDGGRSWQIVVP